MEAKTLKKNFIDKYDKKLSERDMSLLERSFNTLIDNRYVDLKPLYNNRTFLSPNIKKFNGVWNWDSAFHALGCAYFDKELAIEQIEGFLDYIGEDGMLPDVLWTSGEIGWHSSKPPVFPWAALEVSRRISDIGFLNRIYDKLVLNEKFWRTQRFDGKLFYYDTYLHISEEKDLINAKYESGWDNSVRWDNGITNIYPVDLNCFMLMFYNSMYEISSLIKKENSEWKVKSEELAKLIEETFWDEELCAYTDRDRFNGQFVKCLTPASFMPLFVRIASQERAKKMAEIAADRNKFNATMPTVSYDDKGFSNDYWRGPLWLNTAYFAAKGLKNYNLAVADEIKENVLNLVDFVKDGIYENYDTVNKVGLNVKDFSWSACFVMEFILGF